MFTGIVEEMGTVKAIRKGPHSAVVEIQAQVVLEDLHIGDSIAVNGVCLTATAFSRLSSYCMVTVGQGVSTERNFGECGNLGEIFTTEDGLWWRVSGPDTVLLLPENNKTQNYSGSYSSMAARGIGDHRQCGVLLCKRPDQPEPA